jgi:hypothetical protein
LHFLHFCKNQPIDSQSLTFLKMPVLSRSERYRERFARLHQRLAARCAPKEDGKIPDQWQFDITPFQGFNILNLYHRAVALCGRITPFQGWEVCAYSPERAQ